MTEQTTPTPLPPNTLQLDTFDPERRQPVALHGEVIGTIRLADELSVIDAQRLTVDGVRLDELARRTDALSEDETAEMATLLGSLCRMVLDAPAAVHARLTDTERTCILRGFTALQAAVKAETEAAPSAAAVSPAGPTTGAPTPPA